MNNVAKLKIFYPNTNNAVFSKACNSGFNVYLLKIKPKQVLFVVIRKTNKIRNESY